MSGWAAVLADESETSQDDVDEAEAPYRVELQRYLKEKRMDVTSDPLSYWRVKQVEYPHLAAIARRYLCPPPGSAASERLFSQGKNVLGTTRLSLLPGNMEANLFLKYNLRALGYQTKLPKIADGFAPPNAGQLPVVEFQLQGDQEEDSVDIEVELDTSL